MDGFYYKVLDDALQQLVTIITASLFKGQLDFKY